eukprot:12900610-Prorocentrum_lima.AAC.1
MLVNVWSISGADVYDEGGEEIWKSGTGACPLELLIQKWDFLASCFPIVGSPPLLDTVRKNP